MPKTPSIEDRIAARVAEREANKVDHAAQARTDAEDSLPALTEIMERAQRIKADWAAMSAAADRVFMASADAGLTTIRDASTGRNIDLILDSVLAVAAAVKAQAEVTLAPAPEA